MNKVMGIIALLALTGNIASAELLKNFKYDGKIEVNAYQSSNQDWNSNVADGKYNDVDTRVQLNMGFDLNEDVNAVVSIVKNDRQYGNGSQNATGATGILDLIKFEQAYLNLKGVLGFDHKLGRQYYGNEGSMVIYYGPTGMPYQVSLPVSAIDGYTGWYKTGKWDIHGILAKVNNVNDTAAPITADQDVDVFGVNAKYDLREEAKLGAYVYQKNTQAGSIAGPNDHLQVIGVTAEGKVSGIEYGAEFAKNMGRTNEAITGNSMIPNNTTGDYAGYAFKANAKYGIDLAGKLDFMGEFAMGSGDDDLTNDEDASFQAINSDYRPGLMFGYYGMNGLSNLTTWNVGAMWAPSKVEKLTLGAKFYNFSPTEAPAAYDTIGNELDLCANWKHSENVGLKAYFAYFMPNSDYAVAQNGAGAKDDAETLLGAAFTVKF